MSRPPRPHPARSTGGSRTDAQDRLDYLPLEYADLLDLQRRVAVRALGRGVDQGTDVADTYFQLSALVGHVLAVYQRQYAREAFLSTARAPSSLVRHAHRLGSEPDPGLAASGYAVLFTKPGVTGAVAAGQPLASVAVGEARAQDYETGSDVAVDSALNELRPVAAVRPQSVPEGSTELRLAGTGLALGPGDEVGLVGPAWEGGVVESAEEVPDGGGQTVLRLREPVATSFTVGDGSEPPVLLANPAARSRSFGADADPVLFPPVRVRAATDDDGTGRRPGRPLLDEEVAEESGTRWWFTVSRTDGGFYRDDDIYFNDQLRSAVGDDWVLRSTGADLAVFRVVSEGVATVVLNRAEQVDVTPDRVTVTPQDGGFVTSVTKDAEKLATRTSNVSGTVTAVRLVDRGGSTLDRRQQPVETTWSTGWQVRVPLADAVPNPAVLVQPLVLPGLLTTLAPGRPVVFRDPVAGSAQVVRLRRVELDAEAGTTSVEWDALTDDPAEGFTLDRLVVNANVAPVSHGRTVQEKLPASDGVAVFQQKPLRQAPLTYLPGVQGAEPHLEVRVGGVRWTPVADFAESGPDDRHYRIVTAADTSSTVVFGDGRTGAVPPAGATLEATYRIGRGTSGNVGPGRLSRIKRAHPLLDHIENVTPVAGGTEPSGPDEVRSQATRWIRTFDRAVSLADLADLALTMPGIARASASWDQRAGAVLVVATPQGEPPNPLSAVRAFLDARRDTGIPLTLRGPQPHDLDVAVVVDPHPDWLPETVDAAVRDALTRRFDFPAEDLGAPGYLSEVYALLEALAGVVSARVDRFASVGNAGVADAVRPDLTGWLRLQPQHLSVTVTGRSS